MRAFLVVASLLAFVCVAAAADTNPDLACNTDSDCVLVKATCCDTGCIFNTVNKTMAPNYQLDCTNVFCIALACNQPTPICKKDNGVGVCAIPGSPVEKGVVIDPSDLTCKEPSDCQLISTSCCNNGCQYTAVNAGKTVKYTSALNCLDVACPMKRMVCAETQIADCQDGICVAVTNKEEPPCKDIYNCLTDPCTVTSCPAYPTATCTANYCGGCNAVFTVSGEVVNCSDSNSVSTATPVPTPVPTPNNHDSPCPAGVPTVQCFADPCAVTKCPKYPNATCTPNYCGGCNAVFKVDGEVVNCNPCASLPCNQCASITGCSFCSGSYLSPITGKPENIGVCAAYTKVSKCSVLSASSVISSSDACPDQPDDISTTGSSSLSQTVVETDPFQEHIDDVVDDNAPFIIVVTFVVKATGNSVNSYKIFVELTGDGTPSKEETEEICEILKASLLKADVSIPRTATIKCALNLQPTVKRSASYIAELNVDSDYGSASSVFFSFFAMALAAFAMLF